jgi:hypothetical protein
MKKTIITTIIIILNLTLQAQRRRLVQIDQDTITKPDAATYYGLAITAGKLYAIPYTGSNILIGPQDLTTYQPIIPAGTTAQYYRGDKTWQTLNPTAVGLSNVNNTSDANKPISTATQAALNTKQALLSGTSNYIPKYTSTSTLGNSSLIDNGTSIKIGTSTYGGGKFIIATSTAPTINPFAADALFALYHGGYQASFYQNNSKTYIQSSSPFFNTMGGA